MMARRAGRVAAPVSSGLAGAAAASEGRRAVATGATSASGGTAVVWFKATDLRLHDHGPLSKAHAAHSHVVHVMCIDPRWFGASPTGFAKTGFHRARFLSESVADLARSLAARGSSLVVRASRPEVALPAVAAACGASAVYAHSEVCSEELAADRAVRAALHGLPSPVRLSQCWGNTLHDVADLPFDASSDTPQVFSQFRRLVEAKCKPRPPLPPPPALRPAPPGFAAGTSPHGLAMLPLDGGGPGSQPPHSHAAVRPLPASAVDAVLAGRVPMAWELGCALPPGMDTSALRPVAPPAGVGLPPGVALASGPGATSGGAVPPDAPAAPAAPAPALSARQVECGGLRDPRCAIQLFGGETAALARLRLYLWDEDRLREYKQTRNGMAGQGFSSKLSPWLAVGALSPRQVAAEVARYERERVANESTYWLLFELLWRDYFRFACIGWGSDVFRLAGPKRALDPGRGWSRDPAVWGPWTRAQTGYPLVDACMRELTQSGFMSNRGRQNVASFLARDLEADWRVGAEWFESLLADHDPCSNYGNWTYVAGVGADPREDRYFSIPKQARNYDGHGTFMRLWLPEVAGFSPEQLARPQDYPQGLDVVRRRAKLAFQENAHLTDEVAIKRAVAKGRYWVREIHATHALHKYRSIKKRYY
ncbi:hypothetical protein FNF29_06643 [Cafeteria roenbergensis]|uniref:Cryptochrome DASH n=1 Tax=Cafeteria roenbergensis TaxID=33653 RepID=A0A5A8C6H0_CAFRO|nr:hypothetical protein FNF29_06643 [Cafeteria roenbergensis]|eukprot:KAA0148425.1 hypothetical protein FNF29_06643 [Cafeteria roenbergensis]